MKDLTTDKAAAERLAKQISAYYNNKYDVWVEEDVSTVNGASFKQYFVRSNVPNNFA